MNVYNDILKICDKMDSDNYRILHSLIKIMGEKTTNEWVKTCFYTTTFGKEEFCFALRKMLINPGVYSVEAVNKNEDVGLDVNLHLNVALYHFMNSQAVADSVFSNIHYLLKNEEKSKKAKKKSMNVGQLIEKLKAFPNHAEVELSQVNGKGAIMVEQTIENSSLFISFEPETLPKKHSFERCSCKSLENCTMDSYIEPHVCPYKVELFGDNETLCRCCDHCVGQCTDDI